MGDYPLNRWVDVDGKSETPQKCPESLSGVYADMHDGDKKEVTISGRSMTIKPSGNNQTWIVKSQWDTKSCSAIINFNVPGKPNPPPFNLKARLLDTTSATVHS